MWDKVKAIDLRQNVGPLILGALIALMIFVAASATNAGQSAKAEMATPLTLREALILGLERNLDLRVVETGVSVSHEEIVKADADFDLMLDASMATGAESVPSSTGGNQRLRSYTGGVGIGKTFQTGLESRAGFESRRISGDLGPVDADSETRSYFVVDLKQPLLRDRGSEVRLTGVRTAENLEDQAKYRALEQALQVSEDIETLYIDLSRSQEILKLREESRELARELARGNREKLDAGLVPITEVQQAQTALAARDEQVVSAKQSREIAEARLKNLLEIDRTDHRFLMPFEPVPLPGVKVEAPKLDEALSIALTKRPDLKAQREEIKRRDIRVAYLDNQKLPRLDLTTSLGLNGLSSDGSYDSSITRAAQADGYEWTAGLMLTFPLGNRAAKADHRQAELAKQQEIYRLKRLENAAESQVREALISVERSFERFQVAERFVTLAETTLSQELERLGEGLSDTFRVLTFQDKLIEAMERKTTASADYHKGLARLHSAAGINLERYDIVYEL